MNVLARVPITFEAADGSAVHSPLVVGRVGGVTTRLVLDTGCDVHLLTKELTDQLGLAAEPGEEGTDHSGATVPSWSVEDVSLVLGDTELTLRDPVAIPAPRPFPPKGIGGILSPQRLHPGAWTVIDLVRNALLLVEGTHDELAASLVERHPELTTLVLERDEEFETIVVPASIRPHDEIPTLLNTGGRGTEFAATAVPGVAVAAEERLGGGVGDSDVMGATVGAATLAVGGRELAVEELAVRRTMHEPHGLVGMDVLQGTVLAVAADLSRPVLWLIPG